MSILPIGLSSDGPGVIVGDRSRRTGLGGRHISRGHPPTILTDDEVLAIRSAYEFDGVGEQTLLRRYPQMSIEYLKRLLSYEARSKLVPRPPRPDSARG